MLKKKGSQKLDVPTPGEYDLSETQNDTKACGIDTTTLEARLDSVFEGIVPDVANENIVAVITKRFEERLSTREMAFMMSKQALSAMIQEQKAQEAIDKAKAAGVVTVPGQDQLS